ncbi:MAG: glycosyltransferase [Endomicrobia bacterium]|nr:glycosyltransferase [Endomicrobiia bacterium]
MLKELKTKSRTIFYIITSLDYGGTQKQLYYIIKELLKNEYFAERYKIVLISLKKNGRFRKKFEKLNIKVYDLNLFEKRVIINFILYTYAFLKLFFLYFKYTPIIVHSFLFQANFFARLLKVFNRHLKVICSERVAEKQKTWQRFILINTNFLVDVFTVNSKDLKNFLFFSQHIPYNKIRIIPNILNQDINLNLTNEDAKKKLGIDNSTYLICSVGRLHKQKGFDLLLEIIKNFIDKLDRLNISKNFFVIIVGDGNERNNLLLNIKKFGINNYVKLVGYKENVNDYIFASDLFVLTSYWEGSPNVVLEALYFRRPILSTQVEGVSELINKKYLISLNQDREKIVEEFSNKMVTLYMRWLKKEDTLFEDFLCNKLNEIFYTYSSQNILPKIIKLYNS